MVDETLQQTTVRIGEFAREFGLNPKTLRYYESIGLLPQPSRSHAAYRLYGDAERERLRFILKAKALDFSLQEIREILALRDAGTEPCAHVQTLIDTKLDALTIQLQQLEQLRAEFLLLHTEAQDITCSCTPICSIIELHTLARERPTPVSSHKHPA